MSSLNGSLNAVYNVWSAAEGPATIAAMAREAKRRYGSMEAFEPKEVMPRLVEQGLYERRRQWRLLVPVTRYGLTASGNSARADLEARIARMFPQLGLNPGTSRLRGRKLLLAAVTATACGVSLGESEAAFDALPSRMDAEPVAEQQGASWWLSYDDPRRPAQNVDLKQLDCFDSFDTYFDSIDCADGDFGGGDAGGDGGSDGGGD